MKSEKTTPEFIKTLAITALNELKALDLIEIDVRGLTSITDYMVICTGRSNRHVKSLAENLVTAAKKQHLSYINMEGEREGEWVIVDLADVVIHVMTEASRSFYKLEDLWEPIQTQRESRQKL
jgi:ribosome-associated protein